MKNKLLWVSALTVYLTVLSLVVIITAFLQRKIRVKYKFDTLPIFIVLYLINFIFIYHIFGLNWLFVIVTCIYMLVLLRIFSRFQVVGLTGGIGCGKSTASNFFAEDLKFKVIDCDVISREVVQPGEPAYDKIVQTFGQGVINRYSNNNEIDRKALAAIVFKDPAQRRKLNAIMAKPIGLRILKYLFRYFMARESLVVLDAPILFETKYLGYLCYPIITVYITDENQQIQRICKRDNCTPEEAVARIKSQLPISYKIANSEIAVNNDTDVKELKQKIIVGLTPYVLS